MQKDQILVQMAVPTKVQEVVVGKIKFERRVCIHFLKIIREQYHNINTDE